LAVKGTQGILGPKKKKGKKKKKKEKKKEKKKKRKEMLSSQWIPRSPDRARGPQMRP